MRTTACVLLTVFAHCVSATAFSQIDHARPQWTSSRVKGTPDPPLPFITQRVFDDVKLKHPTEMIRVPGSDRWIVTQLDGLVVSFSKSDQSDPQLAINLRELSPSNIRVLGIEFHPDFPQRPWCFLTYTDLKRSPESVRLSRFHVSDTRLPVLDPATETVLLTWNGIDHYGGNLHFGPDGFLYLSIGDGQNPNPPDPAGTGQSIDDIQASILRIDVDQRTDALHYRIPDDNPFVGLPNARGEIWAFGLRNPWKMCFHPTSGELWTGDVGWEMREMVYRIERGANYGWSVMEGSQIVKPTGKRSNIPISPPIFEHDHVDARSITGGFFWQHDKYPELKDAYIYGDWMTGKIWALKYDGAKVTWHRELADTNFQIISFAYDDTGEVLIVGYDGRIHQLQPNPATQSESERNARFPTRLSQTGIFSSTPDQVPSIGVIPYSINAHHWADHTYSKQWIGVPGNGQLKLHTKSDWMVGMIQGDVDFPPDTVFAKTVYYRSDPNIADSQQRVETQILHRHDDDWNAYNYIWNDEQTDAFLQPNMAIEKTLKIKDASRPNGVRTQNWLHASRDQCMLCHIWRAGTVHGFKLDQLNRAVDGNSQNQLDRFNQLKLFESEIGKPAPAVSPTDRSATLEARARQYLHLNCAHCHRRGGGGTASFILSNDVATSKMELIDAPSVQGGFGIPDPKVIASGDPIHSVLLYRMLKSGRGHMPQFGTSVVDDDGVDLIHDWIVSLGKKESDDVHANKIQQLIESFETDADISNDVDQFLGATSSAVFLAIKLGDEQFPAKLRQLVADQAAGHSKMEIRDLFERFLPDDRRRKRLGSAIDTNLLLATPGDPARGQKLYFESDLTCKQCHQIGGLGTNVGPDLSEIGTKRKPAEILDSIVNPSVQIEDAYRGQIVVTVEGEIFSGLVVAGRGDGVHLVDAEGKQHSFPVDDVDDQRSMKKSLMPDQLFAELTLQEAADLLSFLREQKKK